jgi:hypothetical protein
MKSQQQVLKDACMAVLGRVPAKGAEAKEAFTAEVREKIADYMMPLLGVEWEIKSARARARARDYIRGPQPTDLLQAWTLPKSDKKAEAKPDKLAVLKAALEAGLITKEQAAEKALELLSAA